MKLSITFLLISINLLYGLSQPYKSIFGREITEWNIIPDGICDFVYSFTYKTIDDTIFEGKTWKKFEIDNRDGGFLREDTLTGKVWYYSLEFETEYLVMDLSLEKNDTFFVVNYHEDAVPLLVDSVYYNEGLKKIVFHNSFVSICDAPEDESFQFTEGTGSNAGFFYNRTDQPPSFIKYLLCQHKDGIKVYSNSLFNDTCNVFSVSVEDIKKVENLKLFPNPTSGRVHIEFENPNKQEVELKVYNINGELIYAGNTYGNMMEVNLKDKATHINLYILKIDRKLIAQGKILKTD